MEYLIEEHASQQNSGCIMRGFIGYIPDSEILSPNELSRKVVIMPWVELASLLQPDGSIEL